MKSLFRNIASVLCSLLVVLTLAKAAQLKEARVTQIVSDVKLLPQQAAPRPAVVNDSVRSGTAVRTGTQSRSELTFTDLTITRLGADTIFSFEEGTRTMDLRDGAILFQVPKDSGGATIRTTAVTAAITGTTGIGEFHPATASHPQPFSKWLCLEGIFRLILPNGQSVELGPGKMVTTDGKTFSPVVSFDIGVVMKTSLLVNGFDTPLASLPLILIEQERQWTFVNAGGPGTNTFSLLDPANIIDVIDHGITAQESPTVTPTPSTPTPTPSTPTPTPSKFGALATIASDPYVITGDTEITTDPSITTSGHTDFGKIYRDSAHDGLPSAFLFGSTSAFDTTSGFDAELIGDMGAAVFKFTSLQLTGDPMISTNDGPTNLGLIAVNDINSGGAGGVLTFAGIRGLLLATQNGSIHLGPEISFAGLHDITLYARGSGSMLTLASDVSTTNKIRLYGQGGIELSSNLSTQDLIAFTNGNFDITGGSIDAETISINAGGDVNFSVGSPLTFETTNFHLEANGDISVSDSLEVTQTNTGQTEGLNISFLGNGGIHIGGDLRLTTDASNIANGGNITFGSGLNVDCGALTLLVDNSNHGHIGTGGNISFSTGGNLTADSIDALINNRDGGSIDSGGNLTFDIGGALTTTGDASFITSNRNDGSGGGTIASNVAVTLDAASASVGGFFITDISTNAGGMVANATVNVSVTGNLVATGGAEMDIQNTGFNMIGGPFIAGATIGTDAKVNVIAGGILSGDFLDVEIDNNGAGHIGRDAIITTTVSNNISSESDMYFNLLNQANGGAAAGFIGRNASINVSAKNISSGGILDVELINDAGGHIGGNALVNLHASGSITAQNDAFIEVLNRLQNNNNQGSIGGTILGNATNNFSAGGNITVQGILELGVLNNDQRFLSGAGHIGGNAAINFSGANVSSTDYFNLVINNAEGSIDGSSSIDAHATSISTGDVFFAHILNQDGEIGDGASVSVTTTGAIGATSDAIFEIVNTVGSIGGNASLLASAGSFSANSLSANIDNSDGVIDSDASIAFSITGGLTATSGDAEFRIDNGTIPGRDPGTESINGRDTGSITGDASVEVIAAGITANNLSLDINNESGGIGGNANVTVGTGAVSGSFVAQIENQFGGTIGSGAAIDMKVGRIVSTSGEGLFGATITNFDGGSIGEAASINIGVGGNVNATGQIAFAILNNDIFDSGGGTIGSNATVTVSDNNFSTSGVLFAQINNDGGEIGGDAAVNFTAGDTESSDETSLTISNIAGAIGGNASISVNAANITADTLTERIDNRGGTIGSDATIDSTVSGTVAATSDAIFEILNSDGAKSAAINVNGGSYNVGGTFRAYIDGNGTIALNNASVAADVLKVGAFGTNGVLNIGGGILSADTTLKLYASGSNGQINFISDVTLGGDSAKIIAADSVTIFNGVVVTVGNIADENPASIYTNNANYSADFGGNGSTTGTFAGSGASDPQPLDDAPPFDDSRPASAHPRPQVNARPRRTPVGTYAGSPHRGPSSSVIRVRDSDQLLSLLDGATAGANGKITVPPSHSASNPTPASPTRAANANLSGSNNPRTSRYPANRLP